jgi:hypothetical protein
MIVASRLEGAALTASYVLRNDDVRGGGESG